MPPCARRGLGPALLALLLSLAYAPFPAYATIVPNQCDSWTGLAGSGRCYYYSSGATGWTAQNDVCASLPAAASVKGRLVDIRTLAETQLVGNLCLNSYCGPNAQLSGSSPMCCCSSGGVAGSSMCSSGTLAPTSVNTAGTCTSCGTPTCVVPPGPVVNPNGVGMGECWMGASLIGSLYRWSTISAIGSVSNTLTNISGYSNWEPTANLWNPTAKPTFFTSNGASSPTSTPGVPSCGAVWAYSTLGTWILDYCDKTLPGVCVRDAACPSSYYKSSWYSVSSSNVINPGLCTLCPGGQYRTYSLSETTLQQTSCTPCSAGYYGMANSTGRASASCDGVCPQGTYCPPASISPIPCGQGYYGLTLSSPISGPGWSTFASGCAACLPGYYCNQDVATSGNSNMCSAGYCGYAGATGSLCAQPCTAGYYCPVNTPNACPDAPYQTGITWAQPCGPVPNFCPAGSKLPQTVPNGSYASQPVNGSLTYSSYSTCSPGTYCVNGVSYGCDNGTYQSQSGQTSCSNCTAGYYCPGPVSGVGSTVATQQNCVTNTSDPTAGQWYCPAGTPLPVLITPGYMSTPTAAPIYNRVSQQPCPVGQVCLFGVAAPFLSWNPSTCSGGTAAITVNEDLAAADIGLQLQAVLAPGLYAPNYTISYSVANQSLYDPTGNAAYQTCNPQNNGVFGIYCTSCFNTSNNGIFSVDANSGQVTLVRHSPSDTNKSLSLDYEACPQNAPLSYTVQVQATATLIGSQSSSSSIQCQVIVTVADQNDQPRFFQTVYHRVIAEKAAANTPAVRCSGVAATTGCPDDPDPTGDPAISAWDEDFFGQGNLVYSFAGTQTNAMQTFKVNSCSGLVSALGTPRLTFADPTLPIINGTFRRLTFNLTVTDDGNFNVFPNKSHSTILYIWIINVNDPPSFVQTDAQADLWIPENYPAGTATTNYTVQIYEEDPLDTVTLFLAQNDGSAFQIVNNRIVTTATGAATINYESAKRSYSITIGAQDSATPPLISYQTFTVRVVNTNDPPIFVPSSLIFYIVAYAPAGTPACRDLTGVCSLGNPLDFVQSTDPDVTYDGIQTDGTTYSLANNPGGRFQIDPHSGQLTATAQANLNFQDTNLSVTTGTGRAIYLTVNATSNGTGVVTQAGVPNLAASTLMQAVVYLVNVNQPPVFATSNSTSIPVLETTPSGTAVNTLINATDPDNADAGTILLGKPFPVQTLYYSLTPNSHTSGTGYFTVSTDPITGLGLVTVISGLSYNNAPSCSPTQPALRCLSVSIRVTDSGSPQLYTDEIFTFQIIHVNHAPQWINPPIVSFGEMADWTSAIYNSTMINATDIDAGTNLTYTITGGSGLGVFGITAAPYPAQGFFIYKQAGVALRYLSASSYSLRVQVTDQGGSSAPGKACLSGADCGGGAFCSNGYCKETCLGQDQNYVYQYLCENRTAWFFESASTFLTVTVRDENNPPYILGVNTQPGEVLTPITNLDCLLVGSANYFDRLTTQVAVPQVIITDDDGLGVGPWSAPFTFTPGDPNSLFWHNFSVDSTTGAITSLAGTIASATETYNGTLNVSDAGGAHSSCAVFIAVGSMNVKPDLGPDRYYAIYENASIGTIVQYAWSDNLSTIDPQVMLGGDVLTFTMSASDQFSLDPDYGNITVSGLLNYEASATHQIQLQVRVSDSSGASDVANVFIDLIEVNKPPYWTTQLNSQGRVGLTIPENAPDYTPVADLTQGYAADPDIYAVVPAWHQISFAFDPHGAQTCPGGCPFALVNNVLVVQPGAVLNYQATPNSWNFVLYVIDGGGLYQPNLFSVALTFVPEPPVFTSGNSITVTEGPINATLANMLALSTDPNTPGSVAGLGFSITGGDPDGQFAIVNGYLGNVKVLNFEDQFVYYLNVTVNNTYGLTAGGYFTVHVTNVNDLVVTSVSVTSQAALNCDYTTPTNVTFVGKNLGMKGAQYVAGTTITAYYKRYTQLGEAQAPWIGPSLPCSQVVPGVNTAIVCPIVGGIGSALTWQVHVNVPSVGLIDDYATGIISAVSFMPPKIQSVAVSSGTLPTSGGATVTITGSCLGSTSDALSMGPTFPSNKVSMFSSFTQAWQILGTGCAPAATDGSRLVCTGNSPSGLGSAAQWSAVIGAQSSNVVSGAGYTAPLITSVQPSLVVVPSQPVILTGTNFGPLGSVPAVAKFEYSFGATVYDFPLLSCVVTVAYTQITCQGVTQGVGAGLQLYVGFADLVSPAFSGLRFAVPQVKTISNFVVSTLGGDFVSLVGSGFGPACGNAKAASVFLGGVNCAYISATYGHGAQRADGTVIVYQPALCAVLSDTTLACATVPGTGAGNTWSIAVGGQVANVSSTAGTTSYTSPVVGSYTGPGSHLADTRGGDAVYLTGAFFGPVNGAPIVAIYGDVQNPTEFRAVNCTVITADTEIQCLTGVGAGAGLSWNVTVDGQLSRNELSDYGVPFITNVTLNGQIAVLSDEGQQTIALNGYNFGPKNVAYQQPYLQLVQLKSPGYTYVMPCQTISHYAITCVTVPATGLGLQWQVTVRGQSNSLASSPVTNFATPIITSYVVPSSKPTAGGYTMQLVGSGFGLCDSTAIGVVLFGSSPISVSTVYVQGTTVSLATLCSQTWPTSTRVIEFVVPDMELSNFAWVTYQLTTASGQTYLAPSAEPFMYDAPVIDPNGVYSQPADRTGTIQVTLKGINFCASEICCQTIVSGVQVASSQIISHTHTSIAFIANGPGTVYVQCPTNQTLTYVFNTHNPLTIGAVTYRQGVTPPDQCSGGLPIPSCLFNTVGLDQIYVYALYLGNVSVTARVGAQPASVQNVDVFSCYDTTPGLFPSTIADFASKMQSNELCYRVLIQVPPGDGLNNGIVLIANGGQSSNPTDARFDFLSYAAPRIDAVSWTPSQSFSTAGEPNTIISVFGVNFGLSGYLLFGSAGPHQIVCSSSSSIVFSYWHTNISCSVPPGEGVPGSLVVTVVNNGYQSAVKPAYFLLYKTLSVSSWSLATPTGLGSTQGGDLLVVTGANFGRPFSLSGVGSIGPSPSVTIGAQDCPVQSSNSTVIYCLTPPGEGNGLAVSASQSNATVYFASPQTFSYAAPSIYSISPNTGPTTGVFNGSSIILSVHGANFGVNQLKLQFNVSGTEVVVAYRDAKSGHNDFITANHTFFTVKLIAGVGANLTASIIVAGQTSAENNVEFSYDPPVIGSIITLGHSRVLEQVAYYSTEARRRLADSITGQEWFTNVTACRPYGQRNGTTMYTTSLRLHGDATYTRSIVFFGDLNCSEALGSATVAGAITDLGEHPTVPCARLYQDVVQTTSGATIPAELFPAGGFGTYVVSEAYNLYMSTPAFSSQSAMVAAAASGSGINIMTDEPTATLVAGPPPQLLPIFPTSGCYQWESESSYQARLDSSLQASTGGGGVSRLCLLPALISLNGSNFGNFNNPLQGALRVFLVDDEFGLEFEGATLASGGNQGSDCTVNMGCVYQDDLIVFMAPKGSGRNLRVHVRVSNQDVYSVNSVASYQGPLPTSLTPGTINTGNSFLNAQGGELVQVFGQGLGYQNSQFSILLNGRPCLNPQWVDGTTALDGQSSLTCVSQADVAGLRSVFTCVGGQGYMTPKGNVMQVAGALMAGQQRDAWDVFGTPLPSDRQYVYALAASICPNGTYGRIGELCLPCPLQPQNQLAATGAHCYPGYGDPIPNQGFTKLTLDVGSDLVVSGGACPVERINTSLVNLYPDLQLFSTCASIIQCTPPVACPGGDTCASGYQYQYKRCTAMRKDLNGTSIDGNRCGTVINPVTGVVSGVDSDCRSSNTPKGQTCDVNHPLDCSSCVVVYDDPSGSTYHGECQCAMPQGCSLCTVLEYYRINNACVPCPGNPGLVMALYILAAVSLLFAAYLLQKKKINLAFLSVGVDFFQVLAVLSTTNIPWPPVILAVFQVFEIFLASIDIAAPECLVPNLEFPTKFYLTELMPFAAFVLLLLIHLANVIYNVYRHGIQIGTQVHSSRLIGIFVLVLYVLYLSVTKEALTVFNCNPLNPDNGYTYTTFSSLSCDGGGLCRCGVPGGLQQTLVPPAVIFLLIYTVGFPATVLSIIVRYRKEILEDQYLRAHNIGDRPETNPRAFHVRQRFQLMYMYFKPQYSYWMLSILLRKFGVAFSALMFRGNPSFQLAVILLVLFVSFTAQVRNRPFLSVGEYPTVVRELNDMATEAMDNPYYVPMRNLYRQVQDCMKVHIELERKDREERHKVGAGFWDNMKKEAQDKDERSRAEKYFFDVNAVEAVLLGTIIIIALAGIMFESNQFQLRPDLYWTGEMTTVLVFIILFGALLYYLMVFINEFFPLWFSKYFGRVLLRWRNDKKNTEEAMDLDVVLADANPLLEAAPVDRSAVLTREVEDVRRALDRAHEQNRELLKVKADLALRSADL